MTVGDLTELSSWVLSWGKTAKVVEPEELQSMVRGEMEAALAKYEERREAPPVLGRQDLVPRGVGQHVLEQLFDVGPLRRRERDPEGQAQHPIRAIVQSGAITTTPRSRLSSSACASM